MQGNPVICIVGLGYVGLPLAAAFGKTEWKTYGFDINEKRIDALKKGTDITNELSNDDLQKTSVEYGADPSVIAEANTIIIAVPTPIDNKKNPDLSLIRDASAIVGKHLKKDSVVIYESTVYPGVTEEICVPILEKESGLKNGTDFTVGYSPERINPGDKEHTIERIVKVIAGQDEQTTGWMEKVYGKIVQAGTFRAANIKAAELAKALENTQRDINIALINEIARFCDKLGIRTQDVLDAARTKWNFLPFGPGLVGGHCIGVDPYYLVHKAKELGMETEIITAGRRMNDTQPQFICEQIMRAMDQAGIKTKKARVLVLGLTFKENVPDTRNAKVHDLIRCLHKQGYEVTAHDPWLDDGKIKELGFVPGTLEGKYDAIVHAVLHKEYTQKSANEMIQMLNVPSVFYDLRSYWKPSDFLTKNIHYISL